MINEQSCEAVHPLLPAYSIGATDPDETIQVQSHLATCPMAAGELASYLEVSDALLFSSETVDAPPILRERLRAATTPPGQAVSPRSSQGVWERLRQALASQHMRPALAVGFMALAALLALGLYFSGQVNHLLDSQAELIAMASNQQAVLTQVGEGEFLRITLPPGPAGEATGAYATVVCNPTQPAAFVLAEKLPALPPGQAYQVWLIQGEERVSGGLFRPDAEGNGTIAFQAPRPMGEYESVGISAEPAGGSPRPTSPAVIEGSLYGEGGYQG